MDSGDFWLSTSNPVPRNKGWRSKIDINMPIFNIDGVDLGPSPD